MGMKIRTITSRFQKLQCESATSLLITHGKKRLFCFVLFDAFRPR